MFFSLFNVPQQIIFHQIPLIFNDLLNAFLEISRRVHLICTMLNILKKIIGTKNEREINRISSVVEKINALEPAITALTDADLQAKTDEFRSRIADGETL